MNEILPTTSHPLSKTQRSSLASANKRIDRKESWFFKGEPRVHFVQSNV